MADDGLIAAYLRELRLSLGRLADADDFVVEAEDHLREAAERLEEGGRTPAEAEAEAVARFGSAALVARISAVEAKRGAAVPTTRTRQAGLAAMLIPFLAAVGQYLNVAIPADDGPAHGIGVVLLVAAVPAFVFGLWGLRARHGGLGRAGKVAIVSAGLAPFMAFAGYVGLFAALGLLGLAVVVLVVEMLRANVLPVAPLVLLAVGPIGTPALLLATELLDGDAAAFAFVPTAVTAVGFTWLGWHLWREPAYDAPRRRGLRLST